MVPQLQYIFINACLVIHERYDCSTRIKMITVWSMVLYDTLERQWMWWGSISRVWPNFTEWLLGDENQEQVGKHSHKRYNRLFP
jgi:hypothetical protein